MEAIFHEKQEGSLCAQHCLNALLQGAYFTPVDLSTLAQRLDEEERIRMAECGEESEEYQRFLLQPSGNMDDSGYFSIQVISSALEVWGLELVPHSSADERVRSALTDPTNMQAFICNHKDHWFTIRRIANQWFNLNSLLPTPELISNTHLSLILAQLRNDGYSIFVILGKLPDCDADELLKVNPVQPFKKPPPVCVTNKTVDDNDEDLQNAIKLSLHDDAETAWDSDQQDELQKALRLSLQEESAEEDNDDEEAQLRKAIKMSLECKSRTPSTPSSPCDPEDVRNKRIAYLKRTQNL